jgi:hypothetical protein
LLERLFASLVNGPSLNARPHNSRQRVDVAHLSRLDDLSPEDVLRQLLGSACGVKLKARVAKPKRENDDDVTDEEEEKLTDAERQARRAWTDQQALLHKLRVIAEDAKTYEQDTGVHVLYVGFPLLSLPPGSFAGARQGGFATRRVLAPVAFVPVTVSVKRGTTQGVEITCKGEGTDRVVPNTALLAWLGQQTSKAANELFADDEGSDPWREICDITAHVCKTLEIVKPPLFDVPVLATPASPPRDAGGPDVAAMPASSSQDTGDSAEGPSQDAPDARGVAGVAATLPDTLKLVVAPRADDAEPTATLVSSAVLGLFPMTNQGLLRDMQAMAAGEQPLVGPVESFVHASVQLDAPPAEQTPAEAQAAGAFDGTRQPKKFTDERLVSAADPCQSRAVKLARESRGLVIHGPPGTGKSQTITNVVGDHLSRGQRVLFVCDKRTALDVVANRLEHMGLGRLCALIHDPQRDQRELYRAVRQQLDDLPDVTTSDPRADKRLAKIDEDLQSLHAELTRTHESLMRADDASGVSFHDLVGQWLGITPDESIKLDAATLSDATLLELDKHEQDLGDVLRRALSVAYATNPWRQAAGISVEAFVSRPMAEFRAAIGKAVDAARAADATADPNIPPFPVPVDLRAAGQARVELAKRLRDVLQSCDAAPRTRWAKQSADAVDRARKRLAESKPMLDVLRAGPLDADLSMVVKSAVPSMPEVNEQLAVLAAYIDSQKSFLGFLAFGKKSAASKVLNRYGITLSRPNAERAHAFLTAVRTRLVLNALNAELLGLASAAPNLGDDDVLLASVTSQSALLDLLAGVRSDPLLAGLPELVARAVADDAAASALLDGLDKSPARAAAVAALEAALQKTTLFDAKWLAAVSGQIRAGKFAADAISDLNDRLDTVEGVIRTRDGLAKLPPTLAPAASQLVLGSVDPVAGFAMVRRAILAAEITRRLRSDPALQNIDGQRMRSSFERYRALDEQKREIVRDAVLHFWTSKQKERLLASTGSRLSGLGADLRRRLTMRGERAMRLRQVIAIGHAIEGGDPLFDLCPVWMASPETVAQVFPREPLFDVVIFDEASQCRLEEALPVLLRGKRVVIAGDPKQLPPTRFFESAVAQSEDDEPIESDQQLFEIQQGEIEDLLGAALNLSIQQCYLDVHYRSRNADLIGFSNEHFYGSRLQAIPGHPSNRSRFAPLTLYRADGVYKDGENAKEAEHVVRVVKDLLKRADPPSIGIACFNIDQRDLIIEALDEAGAEDAEFGKRLAAARTRSGAGSFEGLFVKNLENVQGDERDHIIISTTYGPDENGRFYRRFGPLGRAGGGRRLNVLVTRAREEVHIVTSIPAEAYRAVPPVPPGQQPGGAWLLFSYLHYAEQLAAEYEMAHRVLETANAEDEAAKPQAAGRKPAARVNVRASRWPSPVATSLGKHLAQDHGVGSDVHWGNDGFAVDLALHHPERAEDVTLGVLCDGTRFGQAQDPVEWDVFRTAIHESQGWRLHRVWSPGLFRDAEGGVRAILREAGDVIAREEPKDTIRASTPRAPARESE